MRDILGRSLYDAAYLAGGPQRVAEAALIALHERAVITVRVSRVSRVSPVSPVRADNRAGHPVEHALNELCPRSRHVTAVIAELVVRPEVEEIGDRLFTDGLLVRSRARFPATSSTALPLSPTVPCAAMSRTPSPPRPGSAAAWNGWARHSTSTTPTQAATSPPEAETVTAAAVAEGAAATDPGYGRTRVRHPRGAHQVHRRCTSKAPQAQEIFTAHTTLPQPCGSPVRRPPHDARDNSG
ncbi:TIGR04222 domain-containing membrane protein [Streptomyces monticola]|uniref:TIGR04222 domain-containing membrane protein n=1 Tax=Streptomyces monticola TaxID=2666263 RepID=A0ABW2JE73_9ACTN